MDGEARAIRGDGSVRILVGVDRLDYTKGIPRRLLAYERMLQTHPELRERVRLVQVAVPSRTGVGAYQDFRALVDGLVGRINGAFGTPRWVPVHYIFRGLSESDLVALYRAADVMLVTPLRDGMNLVAKEFLASRTDGDGVLVLSEFAGAAWELPEALQVNPYDVDGAAEVYYRALAMPAEERRGRMAPLRARVQAFDVHRWAASFSRAAGRDPGRGAALGADRRPRRRAARRGQAPVGNRGAAPAARLRRHAGAVHADAGAGTARRRGDAAGPRPGPPAGHRGAHRERAVPGRAAGVAGRPADLAPRGARLREPRPRDPRLGGGRGVRGSWREPVLAMLREITQRTPGSLVEVKAAALAWHYRMADPETGARRANELRLHLNQLLSNQPVEILPGNRVIEIRPYGVHKGRIVPPLSPERQAATTIVALGDDRTDEDLFAALPPEAITVRVGPGVTRARFRLEGVTAVRQLLQMLVEAGVAPTPHL